MVITIMSQQTTPNKPEEIPVTPPAPEIQRPNDPGVPKSPEEAPGTKPPEISPDRQPNPEINPGRIDQ